MKKYSIYKYTLKEEDYKPYTWYTLVPSNHTIVNFDYDSYGHLCIWAMVLPGDSPTQKLSIKVYGTGWEIEESPDKIKHLKTIVEDSGYVWHYYQILNT